MKITKTLPKRLGRRVVAATAAAAAVTAIAAAAAVAAAASPGKAQHAGTGAVAAAPACQARALKLRVVGTDTAVGSTAITVAVSNGSQAACSVQGRPAISLARADGSALPASVTAGKGPMFGGAASPLLLAPEGTASFFLEYRNLVPVTGQACPPARVLRVRLPGMTGQLAAAASIAPCGTVSVSAIRAGAGLE